MDKENFNYENDLAIDPHALDDEWLLHPNLYMKYSEALAQAQKSRDKIKEKLDVTRAQVDRDIRKKPDDYGISKITETVVAGAILMEARFTEVQDLLTDANLEVNLLQAAVRSFDHRKKALENLVTLYMASYFAGPKEPRDLPSGKRMVDRARDKASEKQREGINRRRRTRKQ